MKLLNYTELQPGKLYQVSYEQYPNIRSSVALCLVNGPWVKLEGLVMLVEVVPNKHGSPLLKFLISDGNVGITQVDITTRIFYENK